MKLRDRVHGKDEVEDETKEVKRKANTLEVKRKGREVTKGGD